MADAEPDELATAVREAVRAGRPQLAARLVGLLGEGAVADDPVLERARRAARLLCLPGGPGTAEPAPQVDELLLALEELRRRRMKRVMDRHKRRLHVQPRTRLSERTKR